MARSAARCGVLGRARYACLSALLRHREVFDRHRSVLRPGVGRRPHEGNLQGPDAAGKPQQESRQIGRLRPYLGIDESGGGPWPRTSHIYKPRTGKPGLTMEFGLTQWTGLSTIKVTLSKTGGSFSGTVEGQEHRYAFVHQGDVQVLTGSRSGQRRRPQYPSPGLVAACLALGISLGGVSWAATSLPKNSVGTQQLKANAVTTKKIKNASLLAADFKPGQLPSGPAGPTDW